MARRIRGITIEIDGETRGLDRALRDIDQRSRSLQQELRDVERLLRFDPSNVEAMAQRQQLLTQQVENTTRRLERLRQAQQQVEQQFQRGEIGEQQYRAFRREIEFTEARLRNFRNQLGALDDGSSRRALRNLRQNMQEVAREAREAEGEISELGSALAGLGAGVTAAESVAQALDFSSLDTKIEISMEVPPESIAAVRKSIATVNSYIDDQEAAIEGVRRQWALNADASDEANARIIKGAGAIARAYAGIDFVELIQEINEISRSLGISNDEALGLTNALLKIGFPPEQLDIISEYGLQLKMAGYDAEEIQKIFAAGIETGTWNIDNLLDGLKEGRIRLAEFGEEVPKALGELLEETDISAKQMQEWGQAVARGGEEGKQAMYEVAQAVNDVRDETIKNALGVAVWGTMYEDQGQAVIDTILNAKDQTADLTENQNQLNEAIQRLDEDPAVKFNQALQAMKVALAPLLILIADLISSIAGWIQENPKLFATISAVAAGVGILVGALLALSPIISAIGTVAGVLGVAMAKIGVVILGVVGVVAALVAAGVALWRNWETIREKAGPIFDGVARVITSLLESLRSSFQTLADSVGPIWESIKGIFETLQPVLVAVASVVGGILTYAFVNIVTVIGAVVSAIGPLINALLNVVQVVINVVAAIVSVLTGDFDKAWDYLKKAGQAFLDFFMNLFTALKNLVSTLIKTIINIFMDLSPGVSRVMESVKRVISTAWSAIQTLFRTNINLVRAIISGDFSQVQRIVSDIMSKVQANVKNIWNGLKSFLSSVNLYSIGRNIIQGLLNGISSMASRVLRKAQEIADGVKNRISRALRIASPSKVMIQYGEWTGEGFAIGLERSLSAITDSAALLSQSAIPSADIRSSAAFGGTSVSSPIIIRQMIVREEADIRRIADELWRRQQQRDRRRI